MPQAEYLLVQDVRMGAGASPGGGDVQRCTRHGLVDEDVGGVHGATHGMCGAGGVAQLDVGVGSRTTEGGGCFVGVGEPWRSVSSTAPASWARTRTVPPVSMELSWAGSPSSRTTAVSCGHRHGVGDPSTTATDWCEGGSASGPRPERLTTRHESAKSPAIYGLIRLDQRR